MELFDEAAAVAASASAAAADIADGDWEPEAALQQPPLKRPRSGVQVSEFFRCRQNLAHAAVDGAWEPEAAVQQPPCKRPRSGAMHALHTWYSGTRSCVVEHPLYDNHRGSSCCCGACQSSCWLTTVHALGCWCPSVVADTHMMTVYSGRLAVRQPAGAETRGRPHLSAATALRGGLWTVLVASETNVGDCIACGDMSDCCA